jgi:uroporphyrin-III C-methyltransferase
MENVISETGPAPGSVWLVGAGPGDPGLLTLRAAAALGAADVVLHDALPGAGALGLARPEAVRVDVGKRMGARGWTQAAINARMIEEARAGRRVVRLKGGDPYVFGRGAEEAEALGAAGIPFRVVPGVTAGVAAPAVAGIPLTHRRLASAVTFVTGHAEAGLADRLDWDALARAGGTVVAFMALSVLHAVALRLLSGGRSPATPVAVIARATLPGERVLRTTLGACTLDARRARLPMPALVVIGAVAGLELGARECGPGLLRRPERPEDGGDEQERRHEGAAEAEQQQFPHAGGAGMA